MLEVKFHGWAAYQKGGQLKEFSYTPRPLCECDVEIEISHCGICGTDLHTIDSGWGPTHYPCIVGHEIIGIVREVGISVNRVSIGNRVGVGPQCKSCGACEKCSHACEQLCEDMIWTYNSMFKDELNGWSQGGFADRIRVDQRFVFFIPENIPSDLAAPLMCAGATVFTPLKRYAVNQGHKVGIVGIGGLGHLAIQFASKMGAEVIGISRSELKKEEAIGLGAGGFIAMHDENQVKAHKATLDLILNTVSVTGSNWNAYLSLLKPFGRMVLVGIPNDPIPIPPFLLTTFHLSLTGSFIGSPFDVEEMLSFAAANDIRPLINKVAMKNAQSGIDMLRGGKARYRVVLCHNEKEVE